MTDTTETRGYVGGSSGPAHSASGPWGTRCVSRCECMPGDAMIALNSLFHSMSSIICNWSRFDLYKYHPGLVGLSVVQIILLPPSSAATAMRSGYCGLSHGCGVITLSDRSKTTTITSSKQNNVIAESWLKSYRHTQDVCVVQIN